MVIMLTTTSGSQFYSRSCRVLRETTIEWRSSSSRGGPPAAHLASVLIALRTFSPRRWFGRYPEEDS